MKKLIFVFALGILTAPAIGQAATESTVATTGAAASVKSGAMVFSADGRRVGRVDRVQMTGGAPSSVSVIYDGHFVYIPVSTLTASDHGFTTSLSKADLNKM